MFTAREIAQELGVAIDQVKAVIGSIDQNKVLADEKTKLIVEVWDGESDIQNIPASHWRDSGNLPDGGHMFLIKDAETKLVMHAQPHAPVGIGRPPMSQAEAMYFGTLQRDQVAESRAKAAILRAVDLAIDSL